MMASMLVPTELVSDSSSSLEVSKGTNWTREETSELLEIGGDLCVSLKCASSAKRTRKTFSGVKS